MVQGEGKHEQEDGEERAQGPAWMEETEGQGGDGLGPNLGSGLTPEGGLAVQPSSAVAVRVSIRVSEETQEEKKHIR